MQITPWTIYWLLKLDAVSNVLVVGAIVATVVTAIAGCVSVSVLADQYTDDEEKALARRFLQIGPATTVVLILLATLTPTTKQAIAMFGIPAALESDFVAKGVNITNKSVELLDLKLDSLLEEAKVRTKEQIKSKQEK